MSATNIVCVSELMFLETSALTGENVEEAFVQCARKILNKIESGRRLAFNPQILISTRPTRPARAGPQTSVSLCSCRPSFSGELDPERMGSGIQYGDAALRQLRSPRRAQPQGAQECGC